MKKQSSIELLVRTLNDKIDFIPMNKWDMIRDIVQQAKAIHKQEIIDAFRSGLKSPYHQDYHWEPQQNTRTKSEQYYKETFEK